MNHGICHYRMCCRRTRFNSGTLIRRNAIMMLLEMLPFVPTHQYRPTVRPSDRPTDQPTNQPTKQPPAQGKTANKACKRDICRVQPGPQCRATQCATGMCVPCHRSHASVHITHTHTHTHEMGDSEPVRRIPCASF